jgi:hypothetical protein
VFDQVCSLWPGVQCLTRCAFFALIKLSWDPPLIVCQVQLRSAKFNYGLPITTTVCQLQLRSAKFNYGLPSSTTVCQVQLRSSKLQWAERLGPSFCSRCTLSTFVTMWRWQRGGGFCTRMPWLCCLSYVFYLLRRSMRPSWRLNGGFRWERESMLTHLHLPNLPWFWIFKMCDADSLESGERESPCSPICTYLTMILNF